MYIQKFRKKFYKTDYFLIKTFHRYLFQFCHIRIYLPKNLIWFYPNLLQGKCKPLFIEKNVV